MKNSLSPFLPLLCVALLAFQYAPGQSLDSLQRLFPDEKAVMLNQVEEYQVDLKNGMPDVNSRSVHQIAYLKDGETVYGGGFGFSQSDFEQMTGYDAYTRTADGKKMKVIDVTTSTDKTNFVFYDDVKYTSFTFPAVSPGATGNLEVTYHHKDPHLLTPFYFTERIPVINSELKITVSKGVTLRYALMGTDTNQISVHIEHKHQDLVYTFTMQHCAADKYYDNAPGYAWYSPHVLFYIARYLGRDGQQVSYLSDADDLYRLSFSYISRVNQVADPALLRLTDSLTHGLKTQENKAEAIYHWVQQHIKYVAFEDGMGGFVPREAGLVYQRRFGDCKDMASILTAMNRAAGVPAYFTWLGTRDLPYTFSSTPLPLVSNHMICTIRLGDRYVFLDGTDPACVFGQVPDAIQEKEAMVGIDSGNYRVLKIPVSTPAENAIVDSTWLELSAGGLKGTIRRTLTGYMAVDFYDNFSYWKAGDVRQQLQEELSRGSNKFELDTFVINRQGMNQVMVSAQFQLPDYAKRIAGDLYMNLNLFKYYANARITDAGRTVPVSHEFKYVKRYVTLLKIPDGYKTGPLPANQSFHNAVWGFSIRYVQKGDQVILIQEFENDSLMLGSGQFAAWNAVLDKLLPLYKTSLNLIKI